MLFTHKLVTVTRKSYDTWTEVTRKSYDTRIEQRENNDNERKNRNQRTFLNSWFTCAKLTRELWNTYRVIISTHSIQFAAVNPQFAMNNRAVAKCLRFTSTRFNYPFSASSDQCNVQIFHSSLLLENRRQSFLTDATCSLPICIVLRHTFWLAVIIIMDYSSRRKRIAFDQISYASFILIKS